jgi:hypothetical protein
MRHTKAVTRQIATAQTTLQVKLDFKTGMASVGVGVAQSLVQAGGAVSDSYLSRAGMGVFDIFEKGMWWQGGNTGGTGTGTGGDLGGLGGGDQGGGGFGGVV